MSKYKKPKEAHLLLFFNSLLIGNLRRSKSGRVTFKYADKFLDKNLNLIASMPPLHYEYGPDKVLPFLENFIPESKELRAELEKKYKIEKDDIFALLEIIGKDVGGAFIFLSAEDYHPSFFAKAHLHHLSESNLYDMLSDLSLAYPQGNTFLGGDISKYQLSLGGMQEKTAVFILDGAIYKPSGFLPSTHLIKPTIKNKVDGYDFKDSVDNEWCCLFIFKKFGFDTAEAFIKVVKSSAPDREPIRALFVERFDRKWVDLSKLDRKLSVEVEFSEGSALTDIKKKALQENVSRSLNKKFPYRRLTEDLCQFFGLSPDKKYEKDGGKTISEIAKLLDVSLANEDKRTFLTSLLMMDILLNTDAHNKNFCLFKLTKGFHLTPFYDVLSLHFLHIKHKAQKNKLKLPYKIGAISKALPSLKVRPSKGKHGYMDVTWRHYRDTFLDAGLSVNEYNDVITELKEKVDNFSYDQSELDPNLNLETLEYIVQGMKERAEYLLKTQNTERHQ